MLQIYGQKSEFKYFLLGTKGLGDDKYIITRKHGEQISTFKYPYKELGPITSHVYPHYVLARFFMMPFHKLNLNLDSLAAEYAGIFASPNAEVPEDFSLDAMIVSMTMIHSSWTYRLRNIQLESSDGSNYKSDDDEASEQGSGEGFRVITRSQTSASRQSNSSKSRGHSSHGRKGGASIVDGTHVRPLTNIPDLVLDDSASNAETPSPHKTLSLPSRMFLDSYHHKNTNRSKAKGNIGTIWSWLDDCSRYAPINEVSRFVTQ
jgi:hypothetical protein